jgi:uncharacterized protein (TIGR03083 family)
VTPADRHLAACAGLTAVVGRVGDRWGRPSPCEAWDARAVLEHVIGFHDVLVLRPAGAKPDRPRDSPVARWAVTVEALGRVLPAGAPEVLPAMTTDVLVHTWDLARAAGVPADLDPDLWAVAYRAALAHAGSLAASGMYAPPVTPVTPAAGGPEGGEPDPVAALVALLGRDPGWTAP